jgi:hypothetical protein
VTTVTLSWEDPEDAARFLQLREEYNRQTWLPDPSAEELLRLVRFSDSSEGGEQPVSARHAIETGIEAWRDGETCDAVHPLAEAGPSPWLFNPDTVKDLARVIARHLPDGSDEGSGNRG